MESQVRKVLDEIRPNIQSDGGDIELVAVEQATGEVTVRLSGACVGCPLSSLTLRAGVERALQSQLPWVKRVKAV